MFLYGNGFEIRQVYFFYVFIHCFGPDRAQTVKKTANQKFRLIYSKHSCEPRTKDCAQSRSSKHDGGCQCSHF